MLDSARNERPGASPKALRLLLRGVFIAGIAAALLAGVAGGLLRAGVALPLDGTPRWLPPAVLQHAFLMVVALLGTVIGIERAVALKRRFAFLVLTIVAERLEMTRLMRRRAAAPLTLGAAVALLLAGAATSAVSPLFGGLLYGLALAALAAWLVAFDIARRTLRAAGLSRYMAVALLLGYAWLGVAGAGWMMAGLGAAAWRDTALHALALGFVLSMVFAHAPVILPALLRVKLLFGPWFYAPLALLHGSLALRLAGGALDPGWRAAGAVGNALAMGSFLLVVIGSAVAWRLKYAATARPRFEPGQQARRWPEGSTHRCAEAP